MIFPSEEQPNIASVTAVIPVIIALPSINASCSGDQMLFMQKQSVLDMRVLKLSPQTQENPTWIENIARDA